MELQEALAQIAAIRRQVARTEVFRGYRAVPIAFSGLLAWATAGLQAVGLPDAVQHPSAYLALWVGAAGVSVLAAGAGMAWRVRPPASPLTRTLTWLAVEQFLPCVAAGGLLTLAIVARAPDELWMLPGLWAILFALGVFASYRLLPRATFWVGVYYLATGLGCLVLAQGDWALSPWAMALPFGGGQLLAAAVFYWTLERHPDEGV
jgi:hypothetical protein